MEIYITIIIASIILILIILFVLAYILHNKVFGKRYIPDPLINYYTSDEFNLKSKKVNIKCGKEELIGNLYYHDNYINDKIIIFAHGMWSSTKAYIQDIAYLCNNNFMVLGFDYIGTDLSTGKSIKGLSNGLKSLDYAIRFIKKEYPNKEIYLVGHSWGAFNSLNALKYHKDIKKVVAMAPFVSLKTVFKGMLPKSLSFLIPFVVLVEFFKCGKYSFANSIKSLNKYAGSAYILHSKNDNMISYINNTNKIINKCKNKNIVYKIVDNKYHNPNYSDEAINNLLKYSLSLNGKTNEEIIQIKNNTDFHKLGELDENIMNDIIKFLK